LGHVLPVRCQALPLLRCGQVGVVLRQRLLVDAGLRALLGVELPRVLSAAAVRRR
jgi:hypothetical protein